MNKLKRLLFVLFLIVPFVNLNAASCQNSDGTWKSGSVSLSTSSISLKTGKSTTFKVTGTCAAGKITITSSDSSIATVSPSSDFLDNSSTTVTVKAKKAGKVTISVELEDVAGYNEQKISGTKKVTVSVKEPTTTTKPATNPTSKTTTKPTTKKTTPKTEPTTKAIKELKVNKFDIVGYDINFDPNLFEYSIEVAPNVDELYILVDGEDIKATGDKKVDITGKDSVIVNLNNGTSSADYKININRISSNAAVPEVKEVIKEVVKENKLYLYTTIALLVVCLILSVLLVKSKKQKKADSYDTLVDDNKITPLQTTHITNTSTVGNTPNVYTSTVPPVQNIVPEQPTPVVQPQSTITPIEPQNINNQIDNNLQ